MSFLLQRLISIFGKIRLCIAILMVFFAGLALGSPQRVVSTSLVGDEILLDLVEEESDFAKKIVALSKTVDDPDYSSVIAAAKNISRRVDANIEALLPLKPDLLILASFHKTDFLHQIKALKLNTLVLNGFTTLNDIPRLYLEVGKAVGLETQAAKIAEHFTLTVENFKKQKSQTELLVLPWAGDFTLLGKNTVLDDIITVAGGVNVAHKLGIEGWSKVSLESLIKQPVHVVLLHGHRKNAEILKDSFHKVTHNTFRHAKFVVIPSALLSSLSRKVLGAVQTLHSTLAANQ